MLNADNGTVPPLNGGPADEPRQ
jgi:hypothetical protein